MSKEEIEEEVHTVTASEQPEIALADLMDEEKKQELIARLETIKGVLDRVEGSIDAGMDDALAYAASDKGEAVKIYSPELAAETIHLLRMINSDVRDNIMLISECAPQESRVDMIQNGLSILAKSGTIYKEIQDSIK
jgi:hypothetical protein